MKNKESPFRSLPLFKNSTESFLKDISVNAHARLYHKGKIMCTHGDKAEYFYLIKSGWIKLFRETLDGTQAVVDILPSGHIFGETAIFEDDIYPYSAEIVEPAEIISVPLQDLKSEIENNSKLALSMLGSMARYRRQQDKEIEHRSIQNAPQHIGCFLLRLVDQDEKGQVTIHLPYDKALVASRLGMQPETFSRALNKLRDITGIRINGATVEMDSLNQLKNYSCSACSSEFPCNDLRATK